MLEQTPEFVVQKELMTDQKVDGQSLVEEGLRKWKEQEVVMISLQE